jgi:hypothetical protein
VSTSALISKRKPLVVLTPEYLTADVSAALRRVPGLWGARSERPVIIAAHTEAGPLSADIVVVPSLRSIADWFGSQTTHWPSAMKMASSLFAVLADAVSKSGAEVLEERDLKMPSRVQHVAACAKARRKTGQRTKRPAKKTRSIPLMLPNELHPLRIYSVIPVQKEISAWWPYYQFLFKGETCPHALDITGRARILSYGPYFVLPAGLWRADVLVDISEDAARYDYLIEFGSLDNFSKVHYRPEKLGLQFIAVRLKTHDSTPLEVRISLLRAAFHGELKFWGSWVTKLH